MKKSFFGYLFVGLVFVVLSGCAVQENSTNDFLVPASTWTISPTKSPQPSTTRVQTRELPTASPQPIEARATPIATPIVEDVFVREGVPVPQPDEVIGVDNAGRLVELARWGYGAIQQITHSADGRLMLVQTDVGVYAYQVATLDEVWRFQPGGEVVASELDQDGQVLGNLDISLWGAFRLAFSPDGNYLASASSNGLIRLWGIMPQD